MSPHSTVMDLRVVAQLRGIPGRGGSLFDDMTPVFVTSTRSQLARLTRHIDDGDAETARHIAHQLAGACGSFGAARMARAARVVDAELRAGRCDEALVDLLYAELWDVIAQLELLSPTATAAA